MKNRSTYLLVVLAALLFAAGTWAQGPTGSIEGTVVDQTKAPLPGVTVEANSPALQGAKVSTSDMDGKFRFTLLPVGTYSVKFTLEGFATQEQANIAVGEGRLVTLQVQMRGTFKEELVVTGSLIPRPTLEAMAPVTTLEVEAVQYAGINRIEDFLTSLPQIFVAQNTSISNGASGAATVDLRDMGSNRTLVLLNGRRLPPGSATAGGIDVSPDLNFIPAGLVKRVDILTGGASATYGADAVAGVVNFIIDKDFVGFKGGISGGGYEHNNDNKVLQAMNAKHGFSYPTGQAWDGGNVDAYVAYGANFADDKGHAMVYIDYRKQAGLFKNRRDFDNCDVSSSLSYDCAGSSNAYPGRFMVYGPPDANGVQKSFGSYTIDPATGNTLRSWSSGRDAFNFNPANSIQRPDERFAAGAFVDYEWNKHARGYLEVMFMDDRTLAEIAPSADFLGSAGTTQVNCNNPMLSADEVAKFCTQAGYKLTDIANVTIGRRNVEGGARIDDLDHQAYRLLAGLKGEIAKGWSYDVYGLKAVTRVAESYLNDMNSARYQEALLVTGNPNDPTTWKCTSGNPACVPMDIFKIGGVTQAALNYINVPELYVGNLQTEVVSGKVNADLREYGLAFPSATEGIQLALGAEYRRESVDSLPDYVYQNNLGMGTGGARLPVTGSYNVKEAFLEAMIPIIQGAHGARDLSLDLGYRYSDFNLSGSHPTWKAEADWAPSADFKFRVAYNRATRAPNASELFSPQAEDLSGSVDPCAGTKPSYTKAQCALTGVTAAQYGNLPENTAAQYNNLYGGNPNLNPEIANTRSFGIVLTPSETRFTAAFDYYDIKIKDTIGALGFDSIMSSCLKTGSPVLCNLIHRDQYGSLWLTGNGYIVTTSANVGATERQGVDVNMTYTLPISKSSLDFNLIGSYYNKVFLDNGIYQYDCVGLYGNQCGTPAPKWRHLLRVSWTVGPATFTAAWRMIGTVRIDYGSNQAALADPVSAADYNAVMAYQLPAYHYVDLAFAYRLGKTVNFVVGVNNIADREPPTGFGYGANGYAAGMYGTYDTAGRYIHSTVTFTF